MCSARVLLAFLRIVDTNPLRPRQVEFLSSSRKGGYLTPVKVRQIQTTRDTYVYTADDDVEEEEIEQGRRYVESDFNRIIEIKGREQHRVGVFMTNVNQAEKAIVFCATQDHAAAARDLINQAKTNKHTDYYVRELDIEHLGTLLKLRYGDSIQDAVTDLGAVEAIRAAFTGFQRRLYEPLTAA